MSRAFKKNRGGDLFPSYDWTCAVRDHLFLEKEGFMRAE